MIVSSRYPVRRVAGPLAGLLALAACGGIRPADLSTPRPVPAGSCVVVGLLGGLDRWDDDSRGVRRLALRLRDPARGVWAETFENRRTGLAAEFVAAALDANGDEAVSRAEAGRARVVVYGQSLGGGAAMALARRLADARVPVDLLVLIDSVGWNDEVVPPNVREAANLFQDDGMFVAGESDVRPADPAATDVILEREFAYDRPPGSAIEVDDLAWHELAFRVAHARMDRDPRVWETAERLVRGACRAG